MGSIILDTLSFLEKVDFAFLTQILGIVVGVFWLFVVGWVWFDASERYSSIWLRLVAVFLTLVFNLFGLIIYLIIRPKVTRDEDYWINLERRYLKFEAAGLEDCPNCGCEIMPNFINCPNCGYSLRVKCKSCEIFLEPEWNVCPFCGEKQREFSEEDVVRRGKRRRAKTAKASETGVQKKPRGFKKFLVGADGFIRMVGALPGKRAVAMKRKKQEAKAQRAQKKAEDKKRKEEMKLKKAAEKAAKKAKRKTRSRSNAQQEKNSNDKK